MTTHLQHTENNNMSTMGVMVLDWEHTAQVRMQKDSEKNILFTSEPKIQIKYRK